MILPKHPATEGLRIRAKVTTVYGQAQTETETGKSSQIIGPLRTILSGGGRGIDAAEGIHIAQRLRPSLQPGAFPELL